MQIEQDFGLRVDRRFRRIQIFWTCLFVWGEGSPSESDHSAGLAGDGEHHPVAKFGIHGGHRWSLAVGRCLSWFFRLSRDALLRDVVLTVSALSRRVDG